MSLTEEQRSDWSTRIKDIQEWGARESKLLPGDILTLAVADHLAAVEAELVAERGKVASYREIAFRLVHGEDETIEDISNDAKMLLDAEIPS